MRDVYLWTGYALAALGLFLAARYGWRRFLDWRDKRASKPAEEETFTGPRYPEAFGEDDEVLEGPVMDEDALGWWAPAEHTLMPALIADALLIERPWPHIAPPAWSAWTGAHPVVRLSDLAQFGATA